MMKSDITEPLTEIEKARFLELCNEAFLPKAALWPRRAFYEIDSLRAENDRLREALEKLLDDAIRLAHASYAQLGACSPPTDPAWHETWKAEDPEGFDLAEQARAALAKAAGS